MDFFKNMNKQTKEKIGLISILVCLLLPNISMANVSGISINETKLAFDVDVLEDQEFIINIKNTAKQTQDIRITAADYVLSDNNQISFINNNEEKNTGIKAWIEPQHDTITLNAGETRDVKFFVNVPEDAAVGSHYGAVIFNTTVGEDNQVQIDGSVATHILINVKGDTNALGNIKEFNTPVVAMGDINYVSKFENLGNIHYVPYGEVFIKNIFTNHSELYVYDKHFVFPNVIMTFELARPIPSIFGIYKATVTFVDGEGMRRTDTNYIIGILFPLVFIGSVLFILFIIRVLRLKKSKCKNIK